MRDTNTLEATFCIVTPLFLGGAEPNDRAELREASIKGALRFWYRAVDPDYRDLEARIFGGTRKGEGQAIFLLRVLFWQRTAAAPWGKERYNDGAFNEQHENYASRLLHSSSDSGTWRINGLQYLSR
jgi:hypothetical protein